MSGSRLFYYFMAGHHSPAPNFPGGQFAQFLSGGRSTAGQYGLVWVSEKDTALEQCHTAQRVSVTTRTGQVVEALQVDSTSCPLPTQSGLRYK